MKKFLVSLLCVMMVFCMMPTMAFAEGEATLLPEAVDGVITLESDVTLSEKLVVEDDITINLNGYTLTTFAVNNNYDVIVNGSLTINGEGNVVVSGAYGIGLSTSCTGGLYINGGTFVAENADYLIGGFGGEVEIKAGDFTSLYCVVNSFDGYTCPVTISGGTFRVAADPVDEYETAPLLGINFSLTGGTYSKEVPAEYCADGYVVKENTDGTYTVAKKVDAVLSTDIGEKTFKAGGDWVEFTFTTEANDDAGLLVYGGSDFGTAYEDKIAGLEFKAGDQWIDMKGQNFGEDAGFELKDASSTFRVKFTEDAAGDYTFKAAMKLHGTDEVVCDLDVPFTVQAKEAAVLSTDIGEKTFKAGGDWVEFTFTTEANDYAGLMVYGGSDFGTAYESKIVGLEYKAGDQWINMKGQNFGGATGFELTDATSTFRVKFTEDAAGSYSFKAAMKLVADDSVVCELDVPFTVQAKETPTPTPPTGGYYPAPSVKPDVTPDEEAAAPEEEKAQSPFEGLEKFKARSKMTTLNGKKAIKLTWNVPEGVDYDGFEVFRSTKRYSGFGTKPFWTTTKTSYTNNKGLEEGKTYYYKVRAFKVVNGEKVYSDWSLKAWRTVE